MKSKKTKKTFKGLTVTEMVKENRRLSREEEIQQHGKPVSYRKIAESKKVYNRKKNKADTDEALPYFILGNIIDSELPNTNPVLGLHIHRVSFFNAKSIVPSLYVR